MPRLTSRADVARALGVTPSNLAKSVRRYADRHPTPRHGSVDAWQEWWDTRPLGVAGRPDLGGLSPHQRAALLTVVHAADAGTPVRNLTRYRPDVLTPSHGLKRGTLVSLVGRCLVDVSDQDGVTRYLPTPKGEELAAKIQAHQDL